MMITCFDATHLEYYDWDGKLIHYSNLEQPSRVSTSFVTELTTGGKVSWLKFNILVRAGGERVSSEIKFFDEENKCITPMRSPTARGS